VWNNTKTIVTSDNPVLTATKMATYATADYATKQFTKLLKHFVKEIEKSWGKSAPKATPKEYVKYTQNYKSMAKVDFDNNLITVQTIDKNAPKSSLQKAIVTTLLTPYDPRGVELYSSKEVKLNGVPYLYKEVKDHQNKYIRYQWRANQYAKYLLKNRLKIKKLNGKKVYYVTIPMLKNSDNVRSHKYSDIVAKYSRKYGISKSLIYAIIKTESNFNPYAVSHIPAYGLMQIVPTSAGRDSYQYIYNKKGTPSREFLFNADNNIKFGVAYLDILDSRYLKSIKNKTTREYCVISAYNTGSGNVLKTFDTNRNRAFYKINKMSPSQVYNKLRSSLPYSETRNYLLKVTKAKREYTNI
jgi:membrane-bound lytic murein transglycosylase C